MKANYTNKDLVDFKDALIGNRRGTIDPFMTIFGIGSRSSYYAITRNPEERLAKHYATILNIYKSLSYEQLLAVLNAAHGIDIRELR